MGSCERARAGDSKKKMLSITSHPTMQETSTSWLGIVCAHYGGSGVMKLGYVTAVKVPHESPFTRALSR